MPLLTDISILYTCRMAGAQEDVHPIPDAAVAWEDGIVSWVGPARGAPEDETVYSAGGRVVVPGLIDCHTHLCFGGWRANEFEQRLKGRSYLDIARSGGGILRTVQQTREASDEMLFEHGVAVLKEMAALGVTTVECKSGYGLSRESELRLLRVYDALKAAQPLDIAATFLGAHVVPSEFADDRDAYVDLLSEELIPRIAKERLAEFCDVFVEDTAFTPEEADRILRAGTANGLRPKLHVDQLSDSGGAALAARVGAVSADHLEYASQEGMEAMARVGVVGVCLPLATLYLAQKPMPAREFVRALAMMLSCTMNRLTPAEALKGATIHAALAIGRDDVAGSIEVGKRADMAVLDAPNVNHWLYHFRPNACVKTYIRGVPQD